MKKITLILQLFCSFSIVFAQAPQKMSYQSVIRKADGLLVVNTSVGIKISILQGSASGTAAYVETQTTKTNANGLATLAIGGGTPVTGTFAGINWASGTYFIKTETDPTGGTNYIISGTSQLLSVPYALYAGSSQKKGKTSIVITGAISNTQAAAQITEEIGPNTENVYILGTTILTTLDLSAITNLLNLIVSQNNNLTTINLSGLTDVVNTFEIRDNKNINSLSFIGLTGIYCSVNLTRNPSLKSVSFPLLKVANELNIDYNPLLASVEIPSLVAVVGLDYSFAGNSLPSSQINKILNKFLTLDTVDRKYISLSGQIPPAPPTGQGIIDKQTLINAGNSVSTD
jgi:hypothetical protein